MARMAGYAPGSTPLLPQRRPPERDGEQNPERFRKQAEYLSTINLSSVSQWEYSLKTLPRPKGRATHVVITEYDLPRRASQPHDVILDSDGIAWYSDFGSQYLGKLDPKTGKVTEYPVPELKPGFPRGALDLESDKDGNLWMGMMLQGGIAKFDKKTEKFQIFALPSALNSDTAQNAMVEPARYAVDGKVWLNNVGIRGMHRIDLASGHFETFEPYKKMVATDAPSGGSGMGGEEGGAHAIYGIAADSQNNIYFMDFGGEAIGRIDAKTGKSTLYPTPTRHSRPRRGHMDSQDRLWFAEYGANKIGMFDTRTERFQEWAVPTPWTTPYDMTPDKNGELWTGGMNSDRIVRMDPKTNQTVEYLLPRSTNLRRVFVDNSTTPVTFWVGSNLGASIVKLEPLD
jgi:virginiamycin B lyase